MKTFITFCSLSVAFCLVTMVALLLGHQGHIFGWASAACGSIGLLSFLRYKNGQRRSKEVLHASHMEG